jgi:hypothetical protein
MDLHDNYQLNNYFARFILQRAIDTNSRGQSFTTFVEAHQKIRQQAGRQVNRHYPFRVALLYRDFYTQFLPEWSPPERARFMAACKEIIDCIPRLDARVRNHRNVVECGQVLSSILA